MVSSALIQKYLSFPVQEGQYIRSAGDIALYHGTALRAALGGGSERWSTYMSLSVTVPPLSGLRPTTSFHSGGGLPMPARPAAR